FLQEIRTNSDFEVFRKKMGPHNNNSTWTIMPIADKRHQKISFELQTAQNNFKKKTRRGYRYDIDKKFLLKACGTSVQPVYPGAFKHQLSKAYLTMSFQLLKSTCDFTSLASQDESEPHETPNDISWTLFDFNTCNICEIKHVF
ncbi:hypothetical protein STEG23_002953, partial [Scotinomys teguina]